MCLLDAVISWSQDAILCRTGSHRDPGNPLRRRGRLSAIAGIEYGLQAAALHGALRSGAPRPAGRVAALRTVTVSGPSLDDAATGDLLVEARVVHSGTGGLIYDFRLLSDARGCLVEGRATIAEPIESRR